MPSSPSTKVTIYDIAKTLGTTHATVSRGLRDDPTIAVATRERIKRQAKKMGYQPNHLSKALAGGKSMTVGVIVRSIEPHIAVLRLRAIEAIGREQGYLTYLVGWGDDFARSDRRVSQAIKDLLHRRVDGLILYQSAPLSGDARRLLQQSEVPVVYIDWSPKGERCAIHLDHTQALTDLARQMADQGHRRAAILHTLFEARYSASKLDKARLTFSEAGIDLDTSEDWAVPHGECFDETLGREVIRRQLKGGSVPSLILALCDEQAAGVTAELYDAGLRVPEDVSVVGFDDSPIASVCRPALTTIHQPRGEVGTAAFKMLSELMSGSTDDLEPVTFESKLIVRQSTGPVAPQFSEQP